MCEDRAQPDLGAGGSAARRPRPHRLALAVLVVVVGASLFFTVHPWYDHVVDASIYISTARSLAAGEGYTYLGTLFHLRPPGFSVLLAPLIAAFGTNFGVLNLFVSLGGAAGVVLLFLRERIALGAVGAGLLALVVWTNPGYQELCNQVLSDVPGVALLLGCLLLERRAAHRGGWRRDLVAGVAIGFASYVRFINVLLLPAIVLSRLWRRRRDEPEADGGWLRFAARRLVVLPAAAVLVLLPWSLYVRGAMPPPPADQTHAYDYATGMLHEDPGDPSSPRLSTAQILHRALLRGRQVASVLGSRYGVEVIAEREPDDDRLWLHAALAAFFLAAVVTAALRRREPAELFCLGALAILLVYFGFRPRLLLPVYVIAFPCAVGLVRSLLWRGLGERRATVALAVLLAALLVHDFHPRRHWGEIERAHLAARKRCAAIAAALPPDARLASAYGQRYEVYLERPVPGFQIAMVRAQSLQAIEDTIDRYHANTVVLWPGDPVEKNVLPYFLERYGPGRAAGGALLWRVRD